MQKNRSDYNSDLNIRVRGRYAVRQCEKNLFPDFPISQKTKLFFSYLNLTQKKFDIFVFAEISQNKYGRKCESQNCLNDYKNNRISMLYLTEVLLLIY